MRLVLDEVGASRGNWSITAPGTFYEGLHLVSGNVGSGKSTLALLMADLFPPASGTITREGMSSAMISFQFPEYHITGTSVREECLSWGLDPAAILASVSLDGKEDQDPFTLSRGEMKRLHLACVLARRYDLLILDEPFSSLDVVEKERVCSTLSGRRGGITIIFTHEQAIFPRVDHIWEINGQHLTYCGPMPGALRNWQHAPSFIRKLLRQGKTPGNIAPDDLREAACRT